MAVPDCPSRTTAARRAPAYCWFLSDFRMHSLSHGLNLYRLHSLIFGDFLEIFFDVSQKISKSAVQSSFSVWCLSGAKVIPSDTQFAPNNSVSDTQNVVQSSFPVWYQSGAKMIPSDIQFAPNNSVPLSRAASMFDVCVEQKCAVRPFYFRRRPCVLL